MTDKCKCWLKGFLKGDGYIDQRHVEFYNSSESVLRETVNELKKMVAESRIKVDIYSENPTEEMVFRWKRLLNLPEENFTLRTNTSPWKSRTEKIRVRVSSKGLAEKLTIKPNHKKPYIRGLFDAEASVDIKGYVEFKQKNSAKGSQIVNEIAALLSSLNIMATNVRTKNDRNIKTDVYFYVKDLEKYRSYIGFVDEAKSKKLDTIIMAKKENKKPRPDDIKSLVSQNKTLWEIVSELKSPYHKVRQALKKNHLAIRQTR
jgi:hypothetical protein